MEITPSSMDTTLSAIPIGENDLMDASFPTLTVDPADMVLDTINFTFDDEESTAIWAFSDQLRHLTALDTGIQEKNVAEEPGAVEPLATLISHEHSFDSTTCPSLSNDSASERENSVPSQYTPPTPVSNSPSLEPARVMPPAPAEVNSQAQPQVSRDPTAEEIEIISQHLQNEWMSLNQYPSAPNPPLAHIILEIRAEGYPRQAPIYYPMHYHEHTAMPSPMESGQFYPGQMVFSSMGYPLPPTYPMPPRALQPPPVSNKRTIEFVEPEVPENFVANPNNHGRWQFDRHGNRHYLNAPKTKRPHTK